MKYRVISIIAVVVMLAAALLVNGNAAGLYERYHQHLEADGPKVCAGVSDEAATHLPIVRLDTDEQLEVVFYVPSGDVRPYANTVLGSIETIDHDDAKRPTDEASLESLTTIHYRGHSSLYFAKKSYKLNFINEDGSENKQALLGMTAHDEWVLNGPIMDRTLIRNYICLNIAGEVMSTAPDVRFCELYVNGSYEGLYLAMESAAQGDGRVNISNYKANGVNVSYIIEVDWSSRDQRIIDVFSTYMNMLDDEQSVSVVYPATLYGETVKRYIEKDFSQFEKAIYSFDYDDEKLGYRHYIDVDSFVDYAVINEFFFNHDAGSLSTYIYKDARGKLTMGPVWDFNNACGNYTEEPFSIDDYVVLDSPLYSMLIKDEYFVERFIERYRELRKSVLSDEYVRNYIDETAEYLGPAIERNNDRWNGYMFGDKLLEESTLLYPLERNPDSYEDALDDLKSFVKRRGESMDKYVETLRRYCHDSAVKKYTK